MSLIEAKDLAWEPEIWSGAELRFETCFGSYNVPDTITYVLSNLHENPVEKIKIFPILQRRKLKLRVHK